MAGSKYQTPLLNMSISEQLDFYKAMSEFWNSVVNKYPYPVHKWKATKYTKEYERILEMIE